MMSPKDKPSLVTRKPKGSREQKAKKLQHQMRGPTATG
jgi:hypothetical protein